MFAAEKIPLFMVQRKKFRCSWCSGKNSAVHGAAEIGCKSLIYCVLPVAEEGFSGVKRGFPLFAAEFTAENLPEMHSRARHAQVSQLGFDPEGGRRDTAGSGRGAVEGASE